MLAEKEDLRSMRDVVIKVENLGKKYTIGHQSERERYTALRDVVMRNVRGVWAKTKDLIAGKPIIQGDTLEDVWALRDLDFEIQRGEAVGIIGRNGAGKSTLLKILSRITEPSTGRVTLHGRVASLLEVGTGFHPELTGRENIYLNGAILGMTRQEIKRKFDEIVAFAEVERYLDTPVKRYSSGMYVRLAFAVAAHLEPEILVVDEVLAVGDAEFQKKCLGKMGDVANEGRTVLFVSHNMGAISALCQRCLVLDRGTLKLMSDDVPHAINTYLESAQWNAQSQNHRGHLETEYFRLIKFYLERKGNSDEATVFSKSDEIIITIVMDSLTADPAFNLGYALYEKDSGQCLWWSFLSDAEMQRMAPGPQTIRTSIPSKTLNDGSYRLELLAALHNIKWLIGPGQNDAILEFTVTGGNVGSLILASTTRPGFFFPVIPWTIEQQQPIDQMNKL